MGGVVLVKVRDIAKAQSDSMCLFFESLREAA